MSEFTDWEKFGVKDFFGAQSTPELAINLAKIISKNILTPIHLPGESVDFSSPYSFSCISSVLDAVDVILLHSSSVHSILNRRGITKEILFKYLHDKHVPVTNNFTKQLLIEKILQFWRQSYCSTSDGCDSVPFTKSPDDEYDYEESIEVDMPEMVSMPAPIVDNSDQQHFPINQMARKFANWFYAQLNTGTLREIDFWQDVTCSAQFLERGVCFIDEQHCSNAKVMAFCHSLRTQYELYFNLNESHFGTQGRIDSHGLVLVLSCGTLHKTDQMVGTFECVFGLARDPFSENNWKINRMKMRLHNNPMLQQQQQQAIALDECETLAPLLSLTVPNTDDGIG